MSSSASVGLGLRARRAAATRSRHRRLFFESLECRALLATFTVNSTLDTVDADPTDGLALDTAGRTTLRAAVMQANATTGNDTIELPAGTYALTLTNPPNSPVEDGSTTGDLDVFGGSITFDGAGRDATIIDASALGDRILETSANGSVGLFDLTLQGGTAIAAGGAFVNRGRSTMLNVALTDNHAIQLGGGIFNDQNATLTISNSLFSGNVSDQGGGAIVNNSGNLFVFTTTFRDNHAVLEGGALLTLFGSLSLQTSVFQNNSASAANAGGGAFSSRTFRANVQTSTFEGNEAAFGGAILGDDKLILHSSTLAGNLAREDGGGIYLRGTAINQPHEIVNNTFSGNVADAAGGAFVRAWSTFVNNTFTANRGIAGVGGVDNDFGHPSTRFQNNVIAGNIGPTFSPDVFGTFLSSGGNLVGDGGDAAGFAEADDQVGTTAAPIDPRLAPLGNNGGSTRTHALLPGSPAIDRGRNSGAPTTDQRGQPRPFNAVVDIGALEAQGPATIRGTKWHDQDGDGARDAGEPGLPGWTIFLDQNKNRVLDAGETSTITGSDGSYELAGLAPGDYFLAEAPQAGWTPTYPALTGQTQLFVSGGTDILTGAGGQLVRTDFDGGNLNALVANVLAPLGVDDANSDLYYRHGSASGTTLRADLDGANPQPFLTGGAPWTYEFDAANNRFFFSSGRDLYKASLTNPQPATIMPGLNFISDIEYDPVTDRVYTANANALVTGDNIWAFAADGSGGTQLIGSLTDVQGLAVDRVNRRLYFSDTIGGSAFIRAIYAADMDGSNVHILVDTRVFGLSRPRDIEVIPELNAIFWIDEELNGLYRAELDGANPQRIASLLFDPEQLEVSAPYYATTVGSGQVAENLDFGNRLLQTHNRPPVAESQAQTIPEDTNASGTLPATDPDGNPLTFAIVANPDHGAVTLNATTGAYTYTPAANYNGPDSFAFKANDGTADSNVATVSITVTAVNDAPTATGGLAATDEDTAISGQLGADDVDGDSLTYSLVSGPAPGTVVVTASGAFIYTPAANDNGPDSFTYKVNDGQTDSNVATFTITVRAANDAPTAADGTAATDEDTALHGQLSAADVDGDSLDFSIAAGPQHGTLSLSAGGAFTYAPAANYFGPDSFTFKVTDGVVESNVAAFSITVNALNDAPIATDGSLSTDEDTAATGQLSAADVDNIELTYVLVSGPAHGTLNLTAATGAFMFAPEPNYNGPDSFTFKANDGAADSNVATFSIIVAVVNDVPVAADDLVTTDEDTPVTIDVLGNDGDVEGNSLVPSVVSGPTNGLLVPNADGSFTYTPAANFSGSDSFTYRVSDGSLVSAPAVVSIGVRPVNDAPEALDDLFAAMEDTPLTVMLPGVLGNDADIDGDVLSAILASGTSHGSLTLHPDGSLQYTPDPNFHGTDSFTYRTSDGAASSNLATVEIDVAAVNDAPSALPESYTVTQDTPLVVAAPGVLANDGDVDGDQLAASLVTGPTHGTLVLKANGSFHYVPVAGYVGPDSFSYQASDGADDSDVTLVSLNVVAAPATGGKINASASLDGGLRSFHINVQAQENRHGLRYQGEFRFDDRENGLHLQSTSITHVRVGADGSTASFQGTASINGVSGFTFVVWVEDQPDGGDRFRVQIIGPDGFIYDSLDHARNDGRLDHGNIDIRRR